MKRIRRRRFLTIAATSIAGASVGSLTRATQAGGETVRWRGYVLGAEGQVTLHSDNPQKARAVLDACFREIRRLERLFSLYDYHSDLCRLNRHGMLATPGEDWLRLLGLCQRFHDLTRSRFDPTIQPLWELFANHFSDSSAAAEGPPAAEVAAARKRTGFRHVSWHKKQIAYEKTGMGMTLNGVAQGYICDRVARLLEEAGYSDCLVELGETFGLGTRPSGDPWRMGIVDAQRDGALFTVANLKNRALATSGGYGTRLSSDGRINHLIDPSTGISTTAWSSVSVMADSAAEADALSTGLMFLPEQAIDEIRRQRPDLEIITQA